MTGGNEMRERERLTEKISIFSSLHSLGVVFPSGPSQVSGLTGFKNFERVVGTGLTSLIRVRRMPARLPDPSARSSLQRTSP